MAEGEGQEGGEGEAEYIKSSHGFNGAQPWSLKRGREKRKALRRKRGKRRRTRCRGAHSLGKSILAPYSHLEHGPCLTDIVWERASRLYTHTPLAPPPPVYKKKKKEERSRVHETNNWQQIAGTNGA